MKVHPVAALFPMLPDDELKDLAADIKANGLQHPIVMQGDVLIDGRNRLAACEIAKVKPSFEELNGQDPVAYILSSNLSRRHMTKGQRAMAAAMVRNLKLQTTREAAVKAGTSHDQVARASTVLGFAPDLADAVLNGILPLNDAYKDAQDRKAAKESAEARMGELRSEAPDLADQVVEERLTLAEALGAWRERRQQIEDDKRVVTKNLADAFILLDPGQTDPAEVAKVWGFNLSPELLPTKHDFSTDRLERIVKVLQALRKEIK